MIQPLAPVNQRKRRKISQKLIQPLLPVDKRIKKKVKLKNQKLIQPPAPRNWGKRRREERTTMLLKPTKGRRKRTKVKDQQKLNT